MIQNKKRIISLILMLTLLVSALVVGAITASAEEESYSYTFAAKQYTGNGTKTLGDVDWTLEGNGGYWGYDGTKGQQFGSGSAPYKTLTLTSGDFTGVKKITINTSGASSINASFTVSVGGTSVGTSTKLTTSATSYTFECDSLDGEVKFSFTQTSSKAIYIKSITIIYDKSTGSNTPDCEHAWDNATCLHPKTCSECGETEGEALGHNYNAEGVCANNCGIRAPKATFYVNGVEYCTVYGETVTLPACDVDVSSFNKYSYTFAGWAVEEITEGVAETTFNKAGENVKLTTDKSFYAVFTYSMGGGEVVSYKKVTSAPDDWSGTYLIVYEDGKVAFNGSLTTLDSVGNTISVTISNNVIKANSTTNIATFTIEKSGNNYTIKSASGKYIGQTSNANGLASGTTTTYANTLTINSDGTVNFVSGGAYLRYNSANDQMRFRYYKSSSYTGQKAINLYAKTIETGTVNYYTTVLEETVHEHSYSAEVTNPTCTAGGYTTYTCECGDTYTDDKTPAAGHSFGEGLIAEVPATCVSTGTKAHKYCSVCEKYFNEAEEEVTYASLEIPVDSSAHDSSLEENGLCSYCGVFYSHTFTKTEFGANGTLSFAGVAWTLSGDGGYWGYTTKGQQLGSGSSPYTEMTLVLAGFKNVSKIVINTSGASDIEATLVVKIGETKIGEIELTSTATEYTFNTAEALSGAITLEYSQTSSKAIYIKSVNVYGEQGSICDHDYADATCTAPQTCRTCGTTEGEALGHNHENCPHVAELNGEVYTSIKDAINAAENGDTITITKDVVLAESIKISSEVTIDLKGHSITTQYDAHVVEIFYVDKNGVLTIKGDGRLHAINLENATATEHVECISAVDGGKVTIENGTFISDGCTAIYATRGGSVTINGGYYEAKELYDGMNFLIDINEAEVTKGVITISGGTFVDFNPANHNNDGKGYTNKVDEGYAVVQDGNEYTVEKLDDVIGAPVDGKITLDKDITISGDLAIVPGTTLDINGKTITATGGIVTFGTNQIIDSGETKGLIKVAKGKLVFTEGGESTLVPVWNEKDGYFLANITDQFKSDVVESENDDSFSVTFRPSLDKNSDLNLSVFGNGAVGNGIKFIIKITGTNAQGTKDLFVGSVSDSIIAQAYENNGAIRITIKGADLNVYTEFNVQLIITNDTSLTHTTTICSYTKDGNGNVCVQ